MIYISLTTVPIRMQEWGSFEQNLKSLLNQNTSQEYKVVLNIPYYYKNNNNEEYVVSNELEQLVEKNPKLLVNRVEEDFGPIVKITGVLSIATDPKDILIICDDDHVYHEDMIEYHLKKGKQYPNSAIAFRGDNPIEKREWIDNGIKKYMLHPTHRYFPVQQDCLLAIPGHWHSVGYKRSFFKDDFLDRNFLLSCEGDDIHAGYYLRKNQIDIVCVTWDKETDWRPVNNHRSAWSFPIVQALSFPESGFSEFRKKSGENQGNTAEYIKELLHNNNNIYIEKSDKVIVTLTTIPSRIIQDYDSGIKSNIQSLINQEYEGEYEIHFNVPDILKHTGEKYVIPDWIRELEVANPKFKIFDNLEDLGPVTKLAHTIRRVEDPEAIIIVCDDDLVYNPKMIEEQVKNQHKYQNTAVGYDGSRAEDSSVFDDVRNHFVVSVYKDVYVNLLQHYKTISYRRKWFEDDFFTDFIDKSWADDISVSAYMSKQGIQRLVTFYEHEEPLITIDEWREKGGVSTFPVLRHTSHEGQEGCNLYRAAKMDENYMYFVRKGYLK